MYLRHAPVAPGPRWGQYRAFDLRKTCVRRLRDNPINTEVTYPAKRPPVFTNTVVTYPGDHSPVFITGLVSLPRTASLTNLL